MLALCWPMAPTPTSFTPAPVRGLLFHTRQHQTSLQTLPHTSLMHPPPRSARLPSHPYQPHRAGHAGPSLPYVGHRLDPSWRILGRCWAHVDVFRIYVGPMLGVAVGRMLALCWPILADGANPDILYARTCARAPFPHAPTPNEPANSPPHIPHALHPPPRSARLPSHPYQPHRAGHAGPSLPYVGHRLDPS